MIAAVQGVADDLEKFPVVHGLHDVVESPHLDGLDDAIDGAEGGDDNHVKVSEVVLDPVQKPGAEAVRGAQIGDDQIRDVRSMSCMASISVVASSISYPSSRRRAASAVARRLVVVDN